VEAPAGGIAADSLAPKEVGAIMFPIAQRYVAQSVLVEDAAIAAAQRMLWDRLRLATEPGGATAFAALASGRYRREKDERLGVLVCGGNTGAVRFDDASGSG
jgi:threonine dehydratase